MWCRVRAEGGPWIADPGPAPSRSGTPRGSRRLGGDDVGRPPCNYTRMETICHGMGEPRAPIDAPQSLWQPPRHPVKQPPTGQAARSRCRGLGDFSLGVEHAGCDARRAAGRDRPNAAAGCLKAGGGPAPVLQRRRQATTTTCRQLTAVSLPEHRKTAPRPKPASGLRQ